MATLSSQSNRYQTSPILNYFNIKDNGAIAISKVCKVEINRGHKNKPASWGNGTLIKHLNR